MASGSCLREAAAGDRRFGSSRPSCGRFPGAESAFDVGARVDAGVSASLRDLDATWLFRLVVVKLEFR
jgi:hypothetical protein